MTYLFTADLHLKVSKCADDYKNFFNFLESAEKKVEGIYILGDLFNYWFEHPRLDLGEGNPALKALKQFGEKGKKVYFLYGNRDFAVGEFFKKHSGVEFLGEKLELNIPRGKVLLSHGDGLAKEDIRYQLWRKMIRSCWASFIFKHLPVGRAIAFADAVKKKGQGKISYEKVVRMIESGVKAEFKKGYDIIIAGHAHYKKKQDFIIDGKKKTLYLLPEYSYPGEFLLMKDGGKFCFEKID